MRNVFTNTGGRMTADEYLAEAQRLLTFAAFVVESADRRAEYDHRAALSQQALAIAVIAGGMLEMYRELEFKENRLTSKHEDPTFST